MSSQNPLCGFLQVDIALNIRQINLQGIATFDPAFDNFLFSRKNESSESSTVMAFFK